MPPGLRDRATVYLLDLRVHSSLLHPFIDKQGNAEQSYMIQLTGEAEKAGILADGKALLDELCVYRDILCLALPDPPTHRLQKGNHGIQHF